MSRAEELAGSADVAPAFANAVGAAFGDDAAITAGPGSVDGADVLGEDAARAVAARLLLGGAPVGSIAVVCTAPFAEALERTASDELLATATAPALEATAQAVNALTGIETELEAPAAIEPGAAGSGGTAVTYPVLDGTTPVACVVVAIDDAALEGEETEPRAESVPPFAATGAGDGFVLAEVEMGVTAELGRCRMTVRELLSITPGAVIDLDRAAGAPVDVLVNGTLIARGEVVVIDEEFGIRISEIPPHTAPAH